MAYRLMRWSAAVLMLPAALAHAQQSGEVESILSIIRSYEHGQSREPLVRFTRVLEESLSSPATSKQVEASLLAFLRSNPTPAASGFALGQLSRIASDASIPLLTGMLAVPASSEMALYALARIPGPAADQALRSSVAKTTGAIRIGVINSLGARRDAGAVALVRPLLLDNEPELAEAAASALARIGNPEAVAALGNARIKTSGTMRERLTEAYVECAGRLAAQGEKSAAVKVYKELLAEDEPEHVRVAALGGAAQHDPAGALPLLVTELESRSLLLQATAIRLLGAMPGGGVTQTLVRAFPKLPPAGQLRLLAALADRRDGSARPLFVTTVANGSGDLRAAALSGLGQLGNASSVSVLAEAAGTSQGAEREAARSALYVLHGPGVDQAIIAGIGSAAGQNKVELIVAAGDRGIAAAAGVLVKAVRDPEPSVRREALRAMRNVAGAGAVPSLLQLLAEASAASDRREVALTLAAVVKRSESGRVGEVVTAYKSTAAIPARLALLEVMGQSSSEDALPVLRESLRDPSPEIARGAILALSEWATPAPLRDLGELARTQSNPTLQVLALRGYLKLLGLPSNRPAEEGAKMLGEVMGLARQTAEKKAILSMLASFPCGESLELARRAGEDQEIAAEARAAVERINSLIKFQ